LEEKKITIEDEDFVFNNKLTRIITVRSHPKIDVLGITIGPFEKGKEFNVKFWIAEELVKANIARFSDDEMLNSTSLHKIHWKEVQIQTGRRISVLPEFFYPKLRNHLHQLKQKVMIDPASSIEYDKAVGLAQDIINCRLSKIVGLSSSRVQSEIVLRKLCKEEQILYNSLYTIISDWKSKILKLEGSK
jgi:hypothetical protein